MATEYISREAAIDAVDVCNLHRGIIDALQAIISDIPAADVRPVMRGKWNVVEKPLEKATICECSKCKHRIWMYDGDDGWNYCPHCGTDMREVTPDD